MSLPPDLPTTNAAFTPAADVPTLQVGATTARLVALGSQTEGHYGLFRWDMASTSGGASAHYHRTFSEAFYVIDGEITLYDGDAWRAGRAGDFLYVPPRGIHAFRNDSNAAASMLILFAPGSPREAYFRELAERIASGHQETEEERAAFLARHDQYDA
jgi:quercetin dioxygenase-like cupin family protein